MEKRALQLKCNVTDVYRGPCRVWEIKTFMFQIEGALN